MDSSTVQFLKRELQRLETNADEIEDDAKLLHDNGVNTSTSQSLRDSQQSTQDDLEQLVSDLLWELSVSDEVSVDGQTLELPNNNRVPVGSGQLPDPRNRPDDAGKPPWAGGNSN